MSYCGECGEKNDNDAQYCSKCGNYLTKSSSLEKNIDKFAEELGRKAEQFGKRIEKKTDDAGKYINQWYDQTFKIAGPLIGAFIALIIMRVIIYAIQAAEENIYILTAFSVGLLEYLLVIFVSMLLSGYNTYLHRKYKQQYQWIYPLISAIGFVIGAWVAAKIMLIIDQNDNTPIIGAIGNFIDTYIIVIFFLALIIGYGMQIAVGYQLSEKK